MVDHHNSARKRAILDTNIWVQICEVEGRQAARHLFLTARDADLEITLTPTIRLEVMSRPVTDEESARCVKERGWVLARDWWTRLPRDSRLEGLEIVEVIRKHRPAWLHTNHSHRLNHDLNMMEQRLWKELPNDPIRFGAEDKVANAPDTANARQQTKRVRKALVEAGWHNFEPGELKTRFGSAEYWRASHATAVAQIVDDELRSGERFGNRSFTDTLQPYMDPAVILHNERDWFNMWAHDVGPEEAPLAWARSTADALVADVSWSPGTPGDAHILGTLPKVEYLISNDWRLIEVAGKMMTLNPPFGPVRSHHVVHPEPGSEGPTLYEQVIDLIETRSL